MFAEFAVEPAIFSSRSNIKQYLPSLRPECGRLVSEIPSTWRSDVEQAIQSLSLPPVEASVVYEYLKETYSGLMQRVDVNWSETKTWLKNVIEEDSRNPFHGIISNGESPLAKALKAGSLHGLDSPWEMSATRRVPKRCTDLVNSVAPLLRISNTVLIIDSYFNPSKKGFVDSALSLISAACSRRTLAPPSVHLYAVLRIAGKITSKDNFFEQTVREFVPALPPGVKVYLYLLTPRPEGDGLHDRYVVTEKGGILVTYGIDQESNRKITTHIARLSMSDTRQAFNDFYSAPSRKYNVLSGFPRVIEASTPSPTTVRGLRASVGQRT